MQKKRFSAKKKKKEIWREKEEGEWREEGRKSKKGRKACEYSGSKLHKLKYSLFFFKFYFEMKMKFF